jgi:hypothetical protein
MKYFYLLIILTILTFISCGVRNSNSAKSKIDANENNVDTLVDVISGYSREDLLAVFIIEVCNPIDSAFNNCVEHVLNKDDGGDLATDIHIINKTVDFISYKKDKLEKFRVYQIDLNGKSKMLEYLDQYSDILISDYREICVNRYSKNLSQVEMENYNQMLILLAKKQFLHKLLFDNIVTEYYELHDKT